MSVQGVASTGQPHLASVAGNLGRLTWAMRKMGSITAPPTTQLLDYPTLPGPHLDLPVLGVLGGQALWLPPLP